MKVDINKIVLVIIVILMIVLIWLGFNKFNLFNPDKKDSEPIEQQLLGNEVDNQEGEIIQPTTIDNVVEPVKPTNKNENIVYRKVNNTAVKNAESEILNNNQLQIKAIQQQILDIKKQYYIDLENLKNTTTPSQQKAYDSIKIHQDEYNKLDASMKDSEGNYVINSYVGLGAMIDQQQTIKLGEINYKIQADNRALQYANQEKQQMIDLLLTTANQKINQLNLQIEQLQLNNQ